MYIYIYILFYLRVFFLFFFYTTSVHLAQRPGANRNGGNIPMATHSILPHIMHASGCGDNERREHTGEFLDARRTTKGSAAPLFFLGRLYVPLQGRLRTGLPRSFTCSISIRATISPNPVALYALRLIPLWSRGAVVVCSPGFSCCFL